MFVSFDKAIVSPEKRFLVWQNFFKRTLLAFVLCVNSCQSSLYCSYNYGFSIATVFRYFHGSLPCDDPIFSVCSPYFTFSCFSLASKVTSSHKPSAPKPPAPEVGRKGGAALPRAGAAEAAEEGTAAEEGGSGKERKEGGFDFELWLICWVDCLGVFVFF